MLGYDNDKTNISNNIRESFLEVINAKSLYRQNSSIFTKNNVLI